MHASASGLSIRLLVLTIAFVACLLTSNVTAVKLIDVAGFVLPGAIIVFPITYLIANVLTEVYGYAKARLVIWLGFGANLFMVAVFAAVGALPAAEFWQGGEAYETILGATQRILVASFAAYLVGEFANAYVLAKLKIATRGRFLWVRTIGSTMVGQSLDSAVFITIAFYGIMPTEILLTTVLVQAIAKTLYEVAATPLTYLVVGWLKRAEGIDVYDRGTHFSPFALTRGNGHG